jgi:uncharacterized protein
MPVNVTFPGVYIEELPSQVRTIVGVPTSITAFIGAAKRGEADTPTHITSWGDFERLFGGLWDQSLMSYAVFHYYQNGGSEAEVVRVAADNAATAQLVLGNGVKLEALGPGAWGSKLRVRVDYDTKPKADPNDPEMFNLTVHDVDTGAEESFRNIEASKDAPRRLSKVLAGSTLVRAAPDTDDGGRPEPNTDATPGKDPFAVPPAMPLTLKKTATPAQFANVGDTITYKYELTNDGAGEIEGPFKVTDDKQGEIDLGNGPLAPGDTLTKSVDYDVVQADVDAKAITNSAVAKGKDATSAPAVVTVLAPGGQAPPAPPSPFTKASDVQDSAITNGALREGLSSLEKLGNRIFNLLCIPPVDRDTNIDFLDEAAKFCVDHRAVLLVDPPAEWTDVAAAVSANPLVAGDNAKNAAVFFPRLGLLDGDGNVEHYPPSGAVAGVIARTDGQRGVWKAPAGTDASVAGIQDLSVSMTNLENGQLNPLGINSIRSFPVIGTVVWGSRTLRGADQLADQWKYLPVRRTALFIEESLYRGTQWVVFEPNDEPLWASIRLNVGAFMNSLWRQGAFQGKTPRDAYVVKCDSENNPQNDIDRGIVNILVGFAPLKPAEFVLIHIQQLAGQIQT